MHGGLGKWIHNKVEEGRCRPLKASRGGPKISYLFFADDLLLFLEGGIDQVACIKEGLELFCKASGQHVNCQKSLMFCSPNIHDQDASRMSANMGIPLTKEIGRYLGHIIQHTENNRHGHAMLLEKIIADLKDGKASAYQWLGALL